MNASMRPSGDSAGYTAESVKNVNCCQFVLAGAAGRAARYHQIPPPTVASTTAIVTIKKIAVADSILVLRVCLDAPRARREWAVSKRPSGVLPGARRPHVA